MTRKRAAGDRQIASKIKWMSQRNVSGGERRRQSMTEGRKVKQNSNPGPKKPGEEPMQNRAKITARVGPRRDEGEEHDGEPKVWLLLSGH